MENAERKKAIIIGAGPAGLTAAYELLKNTDIIPVIYEKNDFIGGISCTYNYKGNRMDMGGHRFFSKSNRVMKWWLDILPLQGEPSIDDIILGKDIEFSKAEDAPDPESKDEVMLKRRRISRIYFLKKFFDYPISLNKTTIKNLGLLRIMKIGFSYIGVKINPFKKESNLEEFFINRFGKELYNTFFKDYTHKVWGVWPRDIPPDWGSQRVKGLSVSKVLGHFLKNVFSTNKTNDKTTETSLIEQFYYPKYGPGHLWESVAEKIIEKGGKIHNNVQVIELEKVEDDRGNRIKSVTIKDQLGNNKNEKADYIFSTMPIKELVTSFKTKIPKEEYDIAQGLVYRDFITVGLLLKKITIENDTHIKTIGNIIPDLWIYVQEKEVKLGRIQCFNNWSPYLVKDFKNMVWLGLEYFANEGDELWEMNDEDFISFATDELETIGIAKKEDVIDACIRRVPKAYPAYFGTYEQFPILQKYLDSYRNLYLIGRNGMHRYNNMDHSMLTAMEAVECAVNNKDKASIWNVNAEKDYHESK